VKGTQRLAVNRERCTCDRLVLIVLPRDGWAVVGWCGRPERGRGGPCLFCGAAAAHQEGCCPNYHARPDDEQVQQTDRVADSPGEAGAR
jgi:hypothetical protein